MTFKDALNQNYVLLDGGFGTELIGRGLLPGESTVLAVFDHEKWVYDIHKAYVDAGADIIMADTFSANRFNLENSGHSVQETIEKALKIAKEAADGKAMVALDISTLGKILEPAGVLTYEAAYELFSEMAICGEKSGADLICLETFTDLKEAKIAALAAKDNTALSVTATLSFDENGKTMNGSSASAAVAALCAAGVSAVGVNCALGPDKLKNVVSELLKYSPVPVIVKPNAGLPMPGTTVYSMTSGEFANIMKEYYRSGVTLLGGCCGTTPEFISSLKTALDSAECKNADRASSPFISGIGSILTLTEPRIIGERINPTGKKRFKEALINNDMDYIISQALEQVSAGADILDINVGEAGINEKEMMVNVIKALSGVIDVPLQIDSTSPEVLNAALKIYTGKAIVNSVNGEEKSLSSILPIVKKYGAAVVGLTLDEKGIPETAEERVAIAEKIINRAVSCGIDKKDIYIDCLTLTVSANSESANVTLDALSAVKKLGVKTVLGVSNISFGLPSRETVNTAFLTLALNAGLDLPIMNPNSDAMAGAFRAFKVLKGLDKNAVSFIEHAVNTPETKSTSKEMTISAAVKSGLSSEAARLTQNALLSLGSEEIINSVLIPTLDGIGTDFEKGVLFLPQLIMAANAAGACFEVIKADMKKHKTAEEEKGRIVIATVKGDVHDIGKNIVKTVLENYGYTVIDLGKDVSPEVVINAVRESGAPLVGLSALMTTTLPAMEETIKLLHISGLKCKIMVGGAVLTEDFATKIGADYYAKDAKASADIAKSIFG